MRQALVRTLVELAEADPRILWLAGDLGSSSPVSGPFAERFPDRFIDVGHAEQSMVGLATGLAEAGFVPFICARVTPAALSSYELVCNGPVLHQLPVRIVGIGGGFEGGAGGTSHHGLEDLGIMRTQPGMTVVAPADHEQLVRALRATWSLPGPVYYRIGTDDTTTIPGLGGRFALGRAQRVRDGTDLVMIATGSVATEAVAAAGALTERGIACGVLVVASVQPAPVADLVEALVRVRLVLTVEAHYLAGGLGSLVAEIVAEQGLACRVVRCGVRTTATGVGGGRRYLYGVHGLSREALVEAALRALRAG